MKIVADDRIPYLKGVLEPFCEVIYLPGDKIDRLSVRGADALFTRTRTKCDEFLLEGSGVKFIGSATIGYDHINTAYCDKSGIYWTNAPGCNSSSVAQYVAAALLELAFFSGFALKGKRLGIVGVGNVGSKVSRFAGAMGMELLLNDPPRNRAEGGSKFVELDGLLRGADIVTLHVPLNRTGQDKTFHLFNGDTFNNMRKGAWLINTSRGEVVNTNALKTSLKSGYLSGVVLDVWENEPNIDLELLGDSFIATPHIAGYSSDGKANGTAYIVNTFSKFFGLPIKNWFPKDIPMPNGKDIRIDCRNRNVEEIVREVVLQTYDIQSDSSSLVRSPSSFESLRGRYWARREFQNYVVTLFDGTIELKEILEAIGFKVVMA